jgi:tetraacyldisaccharide 4'-kinase
MKHLRLLLLPLGILYATVVEIIKYLYKSGYLNSKRSEKAVIAIGNLSLGGTGKTPHAEYVINYLWKFHKIAVLSRGYGRKSKGFRAVSPNDVAEDSGDEPLQIAKKFPEVPVFVCENRLEGIEKIIKLKPETQLLILDDAMQHWPIKADSNILLTTWQEPFFADFPLPAGNLREFRNGYRRADIIIVSKCPKEISEKQKEEFLANLNALATQKVFFSYFTYSDPYLFEHTNQTLTLEQLDSRKILLISGIANPEVMEEELIRQGAHLYKIRYRDHHRFSKKDLENIMQKWSEISAKSENCILMTTEKDATRLKGLIDASIPLYVLPVRVEIAFNKAPELQRALVEVMYKKKGYPGS